jgi:2-polyprenyl-3-methyl-5-hydroxy-6-metoxy-1,4-benzoquinol methylase
MNMRQESPLRLPIKFKEIVEEIVRFTDLSQSEVEYRVWMQAIEPGWNVLQDVDRFDVTPFQFDDKMARLYVEGDGFIFESLVFWSKPSRRLWIQHAQERIQCYAKELGIPISDLKILIHGDGPGNDSLFLASCGFNVDYYEVPGSKTFDFAVKRFRHYGLWEQRIRPVHDYQSCLRGQYDVVLSFEVLEHLPEPLVTIQEIYAALKMGGIALITEDFGDLADYLPTHLQSSAHYLGTTPLLFLKSHMILTWYSQDELFKPYEFVKSERVSIKDRLALLRDYNVRRLYLSRYISQVTRFIKGLLVSDLRQYG